MKKLSVFVLVLVTVLAISSMAFAGNLNGDASEDVARKNGKITVNGYVGPYAAFFFEDTELKLEWVGRENEIQSASTTFQTKTNTNIRVRYEITPLRHVTDNYGIQTTLKMNYEENGSKGLIISTVGPNSGTARGSIGTQKIGVRNWTLDVSGKLGQEIYNQAEGDYKTEVILTIEGV